MHRGGGGIQTMKPILATGVIRYSLDGKRHKWSVGCTVKDNQRTLKAHLKKWMPKAKFLSAKIYPDKPALTTP
jgi:hypothetical protein